MILIFRFWLILVFRSQLGREENSASFDASAQASGVWLETVEYELVV